MAALGFIRATAARTGRPGYDPRDLLKIYLYGYLQQVRSSRRLEAECGRNVEMMWLVDRLVPDHKVISEFRRHHGACIARAGAGLVQWAKAQALLQGGWVAIDGSKFRAVSSTRGVKAAQEAMKRYLAGLDEADATDEAQSQTDQASPQAPRAHPEPDARIMRGTEGKVAAYNVQSAVDTQTGLIISHAVTAESTDNRQLQPMAEQARQVLGMDTLHVVADAGYSNGEQARACEEQRLITYVPANRAVNSQGDGTLYDRTAFSFDPHSDTLRCPAGEVLRRLRMDRKKRRVEYKASPGLCDGCALKRHCTTASRRVVGRHFDEEVLQRMHARATPEVMRLRRSTVELPFAALKYGIFGRPRFLLRGLKGAGTEMALSVLVYNLKKLSRMLSASTLIHRLSPA